MAQRMFELTIDPGVAFRIAELAMEYAGEAYIEEAEDGRIDTDIADNPVTDQIDIDVVELAAPDPIAQELEGLIEALSLDARRDLLALIWFGRGNHTVRDWHNIRREAGEVLNLHVADYLEQTPLVSEWIREGLSVLGYDDEE